ncbi:molybdopterin-binding protein [Sphaerospermopsis kisseleviana CS-549]|uniref:Molybdopterin-binding protein n=1 Tax=Sphaerospermopsis kisseleviana CS-549 TaxID=3021783 RepID=A0ABT4ZVV0_9CYAN|nr:molybdopterin-binding protein [Sphaerospermopsis kisseleviana]MDB9443530.1 molybdopterin-binding protein [Sphaerospermopsis kisseleviana CS-549]BAZ80678.1 molybdenum-pterin binding protein homolog [Sphaerospermopsis kisseleviana NIES-73]
MPRKEQGWVTFQTSEEERKILEEFCQHSQRTKTEILRELVRGLNQKPAASAPKISQPTPQEKVETQTVEIGNIIPKKPLKVSSRNVLKGVVKRVTTGTVNSEITLEIVHKVELTSIITKVSAEELGLVEGAEAYAVIKSNDIVIAKD